MLTKILTMSVDKSNTISDKKFFVHPSEFKMTKKNQSVLEAKKIIKRSRINDK